MPWQYVSNYINPPEYVIDYLSHYTPSIKASYCGAPGGTRTRKNLASKTSSCANLHKSPGHVLVVMVGIDPTSSPYEGGAHPSTPHDQ